MSSASPGLRTQEDCFPLVWQGVMCTLSHGISGWILHLQGTKKHRTSSQNGERSPERSV